MIHRLLQDHILLHLQHFPAIAILGARQVGKTTLAKIIREENPKSSLYLDLELPEDIDKLSSASLFFHLHQNECIILDEIQRMPGLFPVLRALIDENRQNGRFILLGSASPELLRKSSEALTGRIIFSELAPFVFREVQDKFSLTEHWFRGGYPTPLLNDKDEIRRLWFRSYVKTYIESEPGLLGYKINNLLLQRFITMLALNQGGLMNNAMYSRSLGVPVTVINTMISFLENAFLIRSLTSFTLNVKKRLVKSPKLFLRDTGLLHFLAQIQSFDDLLGNSLVGASWESYVIEQIISTLGEEYAYYFYRTQDGTEVDLLLEKGGVPYSCIEVKLNSSPGKTKGLTTAIQDLKTQKNFIIIPEVKEPYPLTNNILVSDLAGFFLMNL
ncbi:MAG: ATP-binding protein [Bacteroidetes bacterium]|nr:ATP-binding protein [Bacteroidota bacterium]